jgi:uncharacterized membrane protein
MPTILGIFDDPIAARRAMEAVRNSSLHVDDISIISRATASGDPIDSDEHISAGEGAAVGAVWGGLVGLAALLIPGIGPFIAGGALFAALTGAATGAVIGGVSGALIDSAGIPEDEARRYETMIHEGKTLVAVKAHAEDAAEIRRILASAGADSLQEDQTGAAAGPVHVAMYDNGRRVDTDRVAAVGDMPAAVTPYATLGIYDMPEMMPLIGAGTTAGLAGSAAPMAPSLTPDATATRDYSTEVATHDPYATREIPKTDGNTWTKGEVVGEGQGAGSSKATGTYDAHQWVGEGQGDKGEQGHTWTKGEVVGEGQGAGPSKDTGTYDAHQWVGEGQGDDVGVTPDRPNTPPPAEPDTSIPDPLDTNPRIV